MNAHLKNILAHSAEIHAAALAKASDSELEALIAGIEEAREQDGDSEELSQLMHAVLLERGARLEAAS